MHRTCHSFLVFGLLVLESCGGPARHTEPAEQHNVIASAPAGFSAYHIGKPHDDRFRLLPGEWSRSLFKKRKVRASPQDQMTLKVVDVSDEETFTANASAWGLVSADFEVNGKRTYATRRLELVDDVLELDETSRMFKAPAGAVYYPWRVYRGWSFEVVCSGSSNLLNSGFKARFLEVEGSVGHFAKESGVECEVFGRGVKVDRKNAVFARKMEEIEERFRNGPAVPIRVEWRLITGRAGKSNQASKPRAGCAGSEGCEPCERWEFTQYKWEVPQMKASSDDWDLDGSAPDVVVAIRLDDGTHISSGKLSAYSVAWSFGSPLAVIPEERVTVTAVDKDLMADDPMPTFSGIVPRFLENGVWKIAHGATLIGACVQPK